MLNRWLRLQSGVKLNKRLTSEQKIKARQAISDLSRPTYPFYLMVVLSTVIASFGLLVGSTAVVIGAMLVAPLMGPIFGIGLGLSSGDRKLIKNAVFSETIGVILAVMIAVLIGLIPIRLGLSPEILSRTQPNTYDIIIALFSGFAGAYALVDEKIGSALPGVAIATALVPPLATSGICLALQQWTMAGGAFLLFFVNFLAIELAAAITYFAYGLVRISAEDKSSLRSFLQKFWLSLTILALIAVFMTRSLQQIETNRMLADDLKSAITEQVAANAGARVSDIRYQYADKKLQVMAEVLTPQEIDARQVAQIEKNLQTRIDPNIQLIVRSMISRDFDNSGYVFITEDEKALRFEQDQQNLFLAQVYSAMREGLMDYRGSSLVDIQNTVRDGKNHLNAIVNTPNEFAPEQVANLESFLTSHLEVPVHLTIRSIITRDADATRYLYADAAGSGQLEGEALVFHRQLEKALTENLKTIQPAANLLEFNYTRRADVLLIVARVRTPAVLGPDEVKLMEQALQNNFDPQATLVVRSTLGADATSEWYLGNYNDPVFDVVNN